MGTDTEVGAAVVGEAEDEDDMNTTIKKRRPGQRNPGLTGT
jgi:hypothetical protein